MSLRRKYPNNKEGRKQRRIAEAACAIADAPDAEEAETKKRKAADADESLAVADRITKQFIAAPSVNTGEHALALYDAAEARLKSNLKSMSDAELEECKCRFIAMLVLMNDECLNRHLKRRAESVKSVE